MRVPALTIAVALSLAAGCYRSHQRAPFDAGPDVSTDAPRLDSPDAPAPPLCVHRRVAEAQVTAFTDHGARTPDLVRTSRGLTTIFLESDGDIAHPVVSAVLTSESLAVTSGPLLVGEESHSWAEALVLEDETLAVAWLSDPGLVNRTAMRHIDATGRSFGDRIDVDFEGSTCIDLARAGDLVAVAYRGSDAGSRIALLAFIDPIAGGRRGERILLGPDDVSPQLAALEGGRVVAALPDSTGVSLRTYSVEGELSPMLRIPSSEPVGRTALAVRGASIALAMQVGESGLRGLRVAFADTSLRASSPAIDLVPLGLGVLGVRIVATESGYTVAWAETTGDLGEGRFVVAHLGPDGVPLESRRVVFAGQLGSFAGPGLASTGARTWLAMSHPVEGRGHAQLFLASFECAPRSGCGPIDARAPAAMCDETMILGYRWDGDRCERLEGCLPCEGLDCDALASTPQECEIDHAACP